MKLKDLVRGVNVTENKIAHKEVPIDKLDAMLNYQRDIDMKRVEMLSSDEYFDENEVDEVKVSVREDGSMKVCDGQHTIAILKMRGWKTVWYRYIFVVIAAIASTCVRFIGGMVSSMVIYQYGFKAAAEYNAPYIFLSGLAALAGFLVLYPTIVKLNKVFPVKNK